MEKKLQPSNPDDDARIIVQGHVLIRDKGTGEVLVDKRG